MRRVRRFDGDGAVCLWWAIERRSLNGWARVHAVQKLDAAIGRFVDDDRAMSLAVFTKTNSGLPTFRKGSLMGSKRSALRSTRSHLTA